MILVDTNIPLRIAQVGHPHRQPALDALDRECEYHPSLGERNKGHSPFRQTATRKCKITRWIPATSNSLKNSLKIHNCIDFPNAMDYNLRS